MPPRSVLLNLGLPNVFTAGKPRTEDVVNEVNLQVQSEQETGRAIVGDGKPEGRDRSHGKHDSMHSSSGDLVISALSYGTPSPSNNASPIDAISPLVLSNPTVDFTASANLAESNHFLASSSVALSSKISKPARTCDNCGFAPAASDVTLKQCSRCKMALYCSAKCQKNNWSAHKKTCAQPRGPINDQGNAANSPSCAEQEKDCEIFTDFSGSSTPISPSEDGMTSTAATSPGLYFDYKTELLNSPSDSHASASIPPA